MPDRTDSPTIQAVTARGVPIACKAPFLDRRSAIQWAAANRATFPGMKVVRFSENGRRTIWSDPGEDDEADGR